MRPVTTPSYIKQLLKYTNAEKISLINKQYKNLLKGPPDVTVVIPAYNEEENILNPLLTISANITTLSVEIIVVKRKR